MIRAVRRAAAVCAVALGAVSLASCGSVDDANGSCAALLHWHGRDYYGHLVRAKWQQRGLPSAGRVGHVTEPGCNADARRAVLRVHGLNARLAFTTAGARRSLLYVADGRHSGDAGRQLRRYIRWP